VFCKGCTPRFPERTHEVVTDLEHEMTLSYTFKREDGAKLRMPKEHAVTFLKVPGGFDVYDENNDKVDPTPKGADDNGKARTLKTSEVIANLSELTAEALLIRCNQVGIPAKKGVSKKDDMVAALIAKEEADRKKNSKTMAVDRPEGDGVDGGTMSPEDVSKFWESAA